MLTERGEVVVTGLQEVEACLRKETSQMPVLTHHAYQAPSVVSIPILQGKTKVRHGFPGLPRNAGFEFQKL